MKIGDLVRIKRTGCLWVIVRYLNDGQIGLWSPSINRPGDLRWTYADALEVINANR